MGGCSRGSLGSFQGPTKVLQGPTGTWASFIYAARLEKDLLSTTGEKKYQIWLDSKVCKLHKAGMQGVLGGRWRVFRGPLRCYRGLLGCGPPSYIVCDSSGKG